MDRVNDLLQEIDMIKQDLLTRSTNMTPEEAQYAYDFIDNLQEEIRTIYKQF